MDIMVRQALGLLLEVLVGLVLAGLVAPLVILVLPQEIRGAWALWTTAAVSVAGVMIVRRGARGSARSDRRRH
jgi:hypothetical protein